MTNNQAAIIEKRHMETNSQTIDQTYEVISLFGVVIHSIILTLLGVEESKFG
jgi:hypothetical protein